MKTNQPLTHKIVALGGGHGLGRVLSALSDHGESVTGIVATTDNGGSTGRIRACQGGIAWGDTRNCINQLITTPSIGSMMFEYRFKGNGELNGHNLGNLMLTALDNLSVRPLEAINTICELLKVETRIVPMSEHAADLVAISQDGQKIMGETCVDEQPHAPKRLYVEPPVPATREAIAAIADADLILLGPGSFLTSTMPPLLLSEIGTALGNAKGKIYFITNLVNEPGPAGEMSLETMLAWCERAMRGRKIDGVISETERELAGDYHQAISPLASPNHEWRHDRHALKVAIERILCCSE
uniref:uridine diphosphate-N-acetylglucosamine-binding protein YvcK n=1 Tax=Thaumasiovibrio occultus TaxID=1891184 RepID=UPI000B354F56|nr:uridine diphosphate-N-acetylglucosamine-binding protein YvcK [Thaumasiovibrio occultus]